MSEIFLSVVVPAYNEERNILETIRRVEAYMSHQCFGWELIIVNDGSTDRTDPRVRARLKESPNPSVHFLTSSANKGKGASARRGILEARGTYILLTDADLSSPIKESAKLIRALEEGYDIAIGSRAVREKGADVQQSRKRWLSGRIFNGLVRRIALKGFRDTQCGFKAFRHDAAKALFSKQTLDGFAFDVEILCLARKNGYKVKEVPVMWKEGSDSRVNLLKDSRAMLGDLFYLRRLYGRC